MKHEVALEADERLEDLQCDGLQIIQNKKLYCFTCDSVILANFVKTRAGTNAVEIGTGCGVVSILVQAKNRVDKIFAFEIQPVMAELASKNVRLNNLEERIEVINDDVKNWRKHISGGVATVFCNPPYFRPTNFEQSEVNRIAKEDGALSCEDLCAVASAMLKDGGSFFVCYNAERCVELFVNLQKHNLATKEMFFTENGKHEVKLVVLRAVKNGKFGTKVHSNLVTNDADGNFLDKLKTKNFT